MIPVSHGGENAAHSIRMNAIIWTLLDRCPHCTTEICKDTTACLAEAQSQKLCGHIAGYVQACLQIWPKGEAGGSPRQTPTAPTLKAAVWCSWADHAFPKSHICQGTFEILLDVPPPPTRLFIPPADFHPNMCWRGACELSCRTIPTIQACIVEKGLVSPPVLLKRGLARLILGWWLCRRVQQRPKLSNNATYNGLCVYLSH